MDEQATEANQAVLIVQVPITSAFIIDINFYKELEKLYDAMQIANQAVNAVFN